MALPAEVRVKISSEAAGSIAITEVSVRSLPVRDLIEQMLGLTGKDAARIHEILKRGSFVAGESRLRWQGFDAEARELVPVLATFPDAEPGRPFDAARCFHVVLLAGRERLDLSRKVAARRGLFRRRTLWDELMSLADSAVYVEYAYKLRCDRYRARIGLSQLARLQEKKAPRTPYDTAEFFVGR